MHIDVPKRISAGKEFYILLQQGFRVLTWNKLNLLISLFFPFLASGITVWIAGTNMFIDMESTKSACFILVCAAIWGGLFNSIQTVVRERKSIRRDYTSGALRIRCYIASRALIQLLLCAFQSAVLCMSFFCICWVYGTELPQSGLIFPFPVLEYYISLFLIVFSADSLGLCISCIVKNEQLASQLSPYILIIQLLFSGVLFEMKGAASNVSVIMISRWGMEALGSISNLNELPLRLQSEFPMIPHLVDDAFVYSITHLIHIWLIMLLFIFIPLVLGGLTLRSVKNDVRG